MINYRDEKKNKAVSDEVDGNFLLNNSRLSFYIIYAQRRIMLKL